MEWPADWRKSKCELHQPPVGPLITWTPLMFLISLFSNWRGFLEVWLRKFPQLSKVFSLFPHETLIYFNNIKHIETQVQAILKYAINVYTKQMSLPSRFSIDQSSFFVCVMIKLKPWISEGMKRNGNRYDIRFQRRIMYISSLKKTKNWSFPKWYLFEPWKTIGI